MTVQSRKDSGLGVKYIVASCFVYRMRSVNTVKEQVCKNWLQGLGLEENSRRKIYVLEEEFQAGGSRKVVHCESH